MDFNALNLLFRCSKEFSHEKIRMNGLSDTEYLICTYVHSNEGCSQDDVVTALKIDKTTVGKALATLEAKGCIERSVDTSDKRKRCLKVTQQGYERIENLMDIHKKWLDEVFSCLDKKEQDAFEDYCNRLLNKADSLITIDGRK